MAKLYHVTGHIPFRSLSVGSRITLKPGTQAAEGLGVYFSEGSHRISTADGAIQNGPQAVFVIEVPGSLGEWWRTKSGRAKRHGRPRTWHSKGKSLECRINSVEMADRLPFYHCEWKWSVQ